MSEKNQREEIAPGQDRMISEDSNSLAWKERPIDQLDGENRQTPTGSVPFSRRRVPEELVQAFRKFSKENAGGDLSDRPVESHKPLGDFTFLTDDQPSPLSRKSSAMPNKSVGQDPRQGEGDIDPLKISLELSEARLIKTLQEFEEKHSGQFTFKGQILKQLNDQEKNPDLADATRGDNSQKEGESQTDLSAITSPKLRVLRDSQKEQVEIPIDFSSQYSAFSKLAPSQSSKIENSSEVPLDVGSEPDHLIVQERKENTVPPDPTDFIEEDASSAIGQTDLLSSVLGQRQSKSAGYQSLQSREKSLGKPKPEAISQDNNFPHRLNRSGGTKDNRILVDKGSRIKSAQSRVSKPRSNHLLGKGIVAVLVFLILLLGGGFFYVAASLSPVSPSTNKSKIVTITPGMTLKQAASTLSQVSLVKNAWIYEWYAKLTGHSQIIAGKYDLSQNMSVKEIVGQLSKGVTNNIKIMIPEGKTISQIMGIAASSGKNGESTLITQNSFEKILNDPTFIAQMKKSYPQLLSSLPQSSSGVKYPFEGYFAPATYSTSSVTNAEDLTDQMLSAMNDNLKPYYGELKLKNISVNTLLSLAALVEKEASTVSDRKNLAQVFFNRMDQGLTLDSDAALAYGQGMAVVDQEKLDRELQSPFNLYLNPGSGPGPICIPSKMSIDAVLHPTANDYLSYLRNSDTGLLDFSTDPGTEGTISVN